MQVSSVSQSYLSSLYTNLLSKATDSASTSSESINVLDSVSLSEDTKNMPPPPHEMDFANMSDADLKDYLQQMYDITGMLPGGTNGDIASLSEDELGQIRDTLIEMSQNGPVAQVAASQETSSSGLSGEDFKSLLTLFMLSMQSSLSASGDSSSSDLLFSSGETDTIMQMMLENLMSKLADDTDTSTESQAQTQTEKAAAAYEQNMTTV